MKVDHRKDFEEYASLRGFKLERTPDSYKAQSAKSAWRAWQYQGHKIDKLNKTIDELENFLLSIKNEITALGESTDKSIKERSEIAMFFCNKGLSLLKTPESQEPSYYFSSYQNLLSALYRINSLCLSAVEEEYQSYFSEIESITISATSEAEAERKKWINSQES